MFKLCVNNGHAQKLGLKGKSLKLPSIIKGWLNIDYRPEDCLLKYANSGDKKALSLFVEHFNHDLFHFLLSQTQASHAEDMLQNTWLKVMEKAHLYRSTGSAKSWLFTLARNTLIDDFRKQNKWQWQNLEEMQLPAASPTYEDSDQTLNAFNRALVQLPFLQREAFLLQQEGFNLAQISHITGDGAETIKSRLRYARSAIKRLMENDHE